MPAPADGFRLLKGTPRQYVKTAASGTKRVHAFCENCGGPVYACATENPTSYSLRLGALKQRYELGEPVRHVWTTRKFAWVGLPDTVQFDEQPQPLTAPTSPSR